MRCAKCGFSNIHGAKFCSECGSPLQMPGADRPNRSANRKVIKLPSDMSNEPTTPIERPWEVRVPKRDGATPTTPGPASAPGAAASSDKTPTPRRRASAAATTGKIPVIKRPASESGRVSDEDRAATRTARTTASTGARSAAGTTTPILIDDFAAEPTPTRSTGATGDIPGARTRRNVRHDTTRTPRNTTGDGKRFVVILIALLIICCLVAFGVFLANSGSKSKTVSFDTDGGTVIGNQYILENGKLERPANPTRPGYTFDGWYLDANYNEEASFPIDVTQDMTLYAKWKQESSSSALPGSISTTTPGTTTPGSDTTTSGATTGNSTGSSSGSTGSTSTGGNSGSSGSSSGAAISGGSSGASSGGSTGGSTGGSSGSTSGGSAPSGGNTGGDNLNGPGVSNGAVNIAMVASNGRTLTGTVNLHDGYVIPNSSEKAYSIDELRALGLNDAELCIARNEPYARQGYSFRNPNLQAYFNARSWYHNTGWRGELPADSAGYITAHNLLALAEQTPGASQWLHLRMR